jgi:hypothetical protein
MEQQLVRRVRVLGILTVVLAGATVGTAIVPDWLEVVFGVDPDAGSGALEWAVVLTLVVLTATSAVITGLQHRALLRVRAAHGGPGGTPG